MSRQSATWVTVQHMASGSNKGGFSIFTPEETGERRMPDHLEVIDSGKGGVPKQRLPGGAYDPYGKEEPGKAGVAARTHKPRVDLRKLSEWIKATRQAQRLRDEELAAAASAGAGKKPGDRK